MLTFLRKLLSGQKGSAIVLVAGSMVVLIGMAGLVVDVGTFYVERAKLQNGVDAAVMAGAARLPSASNASAEAVRFAQLNGLNAGRVVPTISNGNRRIDVTYTTPRPTYFMRIFGITTVDVGVRAAATLQGPGAAFDYTIFSGSAVDLLPINGSNLLVEGSVHSNDDLRVNGTRITITEALEAVGKIFTNGSFLNLGTKLPGSPWVDMPDYSDEIMAQAAAAGQAYNGPKVYSGTVINVNSAIHVNSSVTLNGTKITGNGAILATGDITANGSLLRVSTGDQVCLYSENGDIHVNGNNITVEGILYAPHGTIHINGTGITVNGRIIGNQVQVNGTGFTVHGTSNPVTSLPSSGVSLAL